MDRKKLFSASNQNNEARRQFLEKTGVEAQIKDVLIKLIENRPEDPVSFMADYFDSLGDKVDRAAKAHQQIRLTHYTKPAFHNNVNVAYDILSHNKGKQVRGVTGTLHMQLIRSLCREFPPTLRDKLLRKIGVRDYEMVGFDIFKSTVFTCLVLQDFLKQAEELFQSLDMQKNGKVDRVLCETIHQHLLRAVGLSTTEPASLLETASMLGPEKVYSAISAALFKSKGAKGTMGREEFVSNTAEAFLSKVQNLR